MIFKFLGKNFFTNIIIVILIFILDRISKIYVVGTVKANYSTELFKSKFLNISLIWNEGIAFGLFSFSNSNLYNIISLLIGIITIIIFFMIIKNNNIKKYPLMMIFAGAIGNLYDRLIYNAVPDFIDFHIGEFHWFIFNIADIFISVGVFFMILLELIGSNKSENEIV